MEIGKAADLQSQKTNIQIVQYPVLLAVSEAATQCEIRSYDSYRWKHVLSVCLATYAVFNPNEDNAEISIIVRHRIETGTYHCRKVTKKRNQPNRASQHSVCFGVCRGEEDATE